ncbi:MAG TPA: neuraminidase-like domain-containing protein [Chitinophaga sp.]|uniref:Tc toxin subunit A-related protein n=1 Tax=Chitinophaga sp. TaxID=1869181 RepID=UPI002CBB67E6|nr:neuraminidase-like domain-containing protein [Chitinophaga sp.]HVI47985.1 neuraminidase-like domain-containing protein [Chitinophaga sp.]
MNKLNITTVTNLSKNDIGNLHLALQKLKLPVAAGELQSKTLGTTSVEAIKALQEQHRITPTGQLNDHTLQVLNTALHNTFYVDSKTRTEKLQVLLGKVGLPVANDEKNTRKVGDTTKKAIAAFQAKHGLPADGIITEATFNRLQEDAVRATFSTKTQIGNLQYKLLWGGKVGKLGYKIDEKELQEKVIGESTISAIRQFQTKYKLPVTGQIDLATINKLESVTASRGVKQALLKAPAAATLRTVKGVFRLNKTSPKMGPLHEALSHLGYQVDEKEFKTQQFGKTTYNAVLAFQKSKGLKETGHADGITLKLLNQDILKINPDAAQHKYRVRGSVRNENWDRIPNMVIRVYEKLLTGESAQPLMTKKNMLNGFFDITYDPPKDPGTLKPKETFHLAVKLYQPVDSNPANDKLLSSQIHYNVNRIHWVNFTKDGSTYLGDSDFTVLRNTLQKAAGGIKIENLVETPVNKQVTQLSIQTGLSTDDVMRQILSHCVAALVNMPNPLTPEVFYAFIRQNLPADLPGDLLRGTSDWETIGQLTESAANGIVFLSDELQQQAIDNALSQNLVSQAVKINRAAITQAFTTQRNVFTLNKPILIGNGNLKGLLDESAIDQQHYATVVSQFIDSRGINDDFWEELKKQEGTIGANAIADFATTVQAGNIAKNHAPTVQFLKSNIGAGKQFKAIGDVAKLDYTGLVNLINQNGKKVPDNMPGNTADEKVANYAAALQQRTETIFPAVALVASAQRSGDNNLQTLPDIAAFIDANTTLNLRRDNLDKYVLDNKIDLAPKTLEELKVIQRVNKITTNIKAGNALLSEKLHSSRQIYFAGKDQIVKTLTDKGVEIKAAQRVYEIAKMQYFQVLARFIDFRPEINIGTPQVIIPQLYTKEELKTILGDIPDLETLFGSLDYCDCEHCKSLYGPAAYFTDLLRYLNTHLSLVKEGPKTLSVKEVLFKRRPDLGNVKLNCENTNTPLPYIDLVCEILENNIAPAQINFSYQTTLSDKELRAMPEHLRSDAYSTLASADYPMTGVLNLWQEETSTYLNYLRVPRPELMEAFQDISNPANKVPTDEAIAAAYFGICTHEKDLIITARATQPDQDKYWGFDTTQTTVPVSAFMQRSKLSYYEVLELLLVKSVNDPVNNKSVIERPVDTCDTAQQQITHLTLQKFDLMHRFIRLWRRTGWKMWELDLLLQNGKIGASSINGATLVNLRAFKQLGDKLKLPLEVLLALYGNINTAQRIQPDNPDVIIPSLYDQLFQNPVITQPVDVKFALNAADRQHLVDETVPLGLAVGYTPVPTILSALAMQQTDFDVLAGKTDGHLSLSSLSVLLRYIYLAKGLKRSVKDLLLLLGITNTTDPFSSVQATLDVIKNYEYIQRSGITLLELDYVLNYSPDSPIGLRNESLVQLIDVLRKILANNKEKIDQLSLSPADRAAILAFDADGLSPMTNPQLITALTPLQTILNNANAGFVLAGFSVEEATFIIKFDTVNITNASKAKLIATIKQLQQNLTDLLNQNNNQVKSQVAASFGLTDEQASILLNSLHLAPATDTLLQVLEDPNLLTKDGNDNYLDITAANFPAQFRAYVLLHKVALVVVRMKMETPNLEWFIQQQAAVKALNFSALPVAPVVTPNGYTGWLNLYLFLDFAAAYPEPETASIRSILDLARNAAATKTDIQKEIVKLTQTSKTDLETFDAAFHLQHAVGHLDYTDANLYARLRRCWAQMRLTGVDAATMFAWAVINADLLLDAAVTLQTRNAVKSKYEQDDWLSKITPLYDDIREKKRQALVDYLLEYSQRTQSDTVLFNGKTIPNPLYWKDVKSLFKYFLIDVEMCSCQLTSRIKQAISSVQLFVQRCFLNLENRYVQVTQDEKEDTSSPNAWSQWKWMKNYRIWEANRKVFFYPENWIEPELRDDKSPFFEELENELMQNEVNSDNVEAAMLSYLHKVDDVSHLEVCGEYHEMEDLDVSEAGYERNIVHVIGRTKTLPHVYYYRSYDMNYATWTAWEKIEADIQSDQVIPVVYNRKLHLFWLVFAEKPIKMHKVPAAKVTNGPTDAPAPPMVLEIQLGWAIKKTGGWSTKKLSKQKLIHPWQRPHFAYNLKPYYLAKYNELYLDIYLSTTQEFNDGWFYDPFQDKYVKVTGNPFNETFLPWHSSSFVFNGEVKEVKLKGLGGHFHFEFPLPGGGNYTIDQWLPYDSYVYVNQNFGEDGRAIKELQPQFEYGPRLRLPNGMHFNNTRLTNNIHDAINPNQLRILESNATVTLLKNAASNGSPSTTTGSFEMVIAQQDLQLNTLATDHPVFYQDSQRAFFIKPEWEAILNNYGQVISSVRKYRFQPFYHPYTTLFIRELNRSGIDGLLKRKVQTQPQTFPPANTFNFNHYVPGSNVIVDAAAKTDVVDFSFGGAYSIYNWELFFHAPLMIACRLSQNQQFEDAMRWFHYIFDPTNIENLPTPQRYWVTKPFFEFNTDDYRKQRIENILTNINLAENQAQLKAWRNNPFKPHLIARYRPVAYQKTVVMKYLDNLISWGDQLFMRDTIESINEATLLYMLAWEILGERPQKAPNVKHDDMSFNELEQKLDEFGNAQVDVIIENTLLPINVVADTNGGEPVPQLETFYFCIPNNDKLLTYWDTVQDRLFKIHHCMNIEGIVRQLPLFEPPIDPALLVKAAAAGIDLSSVLNDVSAPAPHYRFRVVVQKAIDFCNEVKFLGEKLLSALEKKDIEGLALMRSQQEIQLLEAVKEVRKKQIDEQVETIGSLQKTQALAQQKKTYYEGVPRMNDWETAGAVVHVIGIASEIASTIVNIFGAGISMVPDIDAGGTGVGGSPTAKLKFGGTNFGNAASKVAEVLKSASSILHSTGSLLESQGAYTRRDAENKNQATLATIEIDQIQFQINAAQIRQSIAEKELENQELQIDNAKTMDDYMRNKYTNQQLYNWMITQISTVYFQSYQLAFDMAKKAEKCYQLELGTSVSNFIQFGYWDSLKKGLLSGDKLMNDLRRLEAAYLDQNKRELEIVKHISLAQMAPMALITLKETGKCTISIPEWIYDMDYPGHYMRRIKNVSISIPCVVGPYTGVNCTLSLLKSETRIDPTGGYDKVGEDDPRFKVQYGAISSIATSHAQNDNGLFELNFNDERYLPFECAGAVSDWKIDLPRENNYFDFGSIADVILHISYTARSGGGGLTQAASANLAAVLPNAVAKLFSLKHEFPTEWYKMLHPVNGADQELVITLRPEHFPFFIRSKLNTLKMKQLDMFVETSDSGEFRTDIKLTSTAYVTDLVVGADPNYNNIQHLTRNVSAGSPAALGEVKLKVKLATAIDYKSLPDDKIDDLFILLQLGS